ncbi:MAG: hypothetical protein IJW73_01620 [Candidatus Gastranaerophilales bacterium]|nr:hypothetical protein [Candidatus Gastranaerophilales bacterium]
MNNLKVFGKFLDQPILISKLNKNAPAILATGGALLLANNAIDTFQKSQDKDVSKKEIFKKGIVMATAIASALVAPKIASKITKRAPLETLEQIQKANDKLINDFASKNNIDENIQPLLTKAKEEVLSLAEIKTLSSSLNKTKAGEELFNKLIPDPQNIKASDIFSEIGYLSIYGAIPVAGGILGGISADILAKDDYKKTMPDKINEGIYQYLANIFMCNIGAGVALGLLEKAGITSKSARAIGMTTGIVLTGILGGSKIANLISQKVINPIINPKGHSKERKPELLDAGLHVDDIATVSLLSGLKWIEPMLPALYSISGYKAGVGYRN